ncbi:alpha/beta hydrolase family esterase [Nocardia sp. CDC160]|uniref:alpha/beta hydrolase family esterase n=1 Tax=Nocardia sp. CDC160 TaxID=3112166 RepID=UPI002DB58E8C|nr:PHB depolymerase family esterase [Nocardia sp. CDC160]MEC3915627.1 PHB depolymerase family esterase [Nocardia sp. CDC160]
MFTRVMLALVALLIGSALISPLAAPGPAQAAVPGCSTAPTEGIFGLTRQVAPSGRGYTLYVPPGVSDHASLVLDLAGAAVPTLAELATDGWRQFADGKDLIVAWPDASGVGSLFWNYAENSNDVAALRDVVSDISAKHCVDARHVHAWGWSNGAMMAHRLACDAGDVFASVAAYEAPWFPTGVNLAGPMDGDFRLFTGCAPKRPISVGVFEAALDFNYWLNPSMHTEWVNRNHCGPNRIPDTGAQPTTEGTRWTDCDGGTEVLWRVYVLGIHQPPFWLAPDMLDRTWQLFRDNPLPA